MKITFCVCVLIEVLFFARLTGGILSWVKKASLLFIFPCFVLYPTLLCRCWVCLCVYILGASLLRGSPESHRMLPESGHLSMSSHQGNQGNVAFYSMCYCTQAKISILLKKKKGGECIFGTDSQQSLLQVLTYFSSFFPPTIHLFYTLVEDTHFDHWSEYGIAFLTSVSLLIMFSCLKCLWTPFLGVCILQGTDWSSPST